MRGLRLMRGFRRCRTDRGISLCVVALAGVGVVLALSGTAVAAVSTGFIENRGQLDDEVLYYARGGGASIYFTAAAVVIDLREELEVASGHRGPGRPLSDIGMGETTPDSVARRGCAVWVRFEDARPDPVIEARGELVTRYNYFLGDNPDEWETDVPAYTEVVYRDLWPGVDLVYRHDAGALEYQFLAAPGATAGRFRYEGADRVSENETGVREIETAFGVLLDAPRTRGAETGRYTWLGESADRPGDEVFPRGSGRDNPASLIWSTFLGGPDSDSIVSVVLDSLGNALVMGTTEFPEFPTTPGAYDESFNGVRDAFVAKVGSTDGSLLWSTFLGGTDYDYGTALVLDSEGNLAVVGTTSSPDFPTTEGTYDESHNGGRDVFVGKLSSAGSDLLWSTFLGGSEDDIGNGIALDASDNPVVTTFLTQSPDFPTTEGAYDTSPNGDWDVSITKFDASGSALLWSTFLGGLAQDLKALPAIDPSGNVVVAGQTLSTDFPVTPGAFDHTFNYAGSFWYDCFVAKLDASGSTLLWGTFLGGTETDGVGGIALDSASNIVIAGGTCSSEFPVTPGAYDESFDGEHDAFVSKLSASGANLLWSTFLGGSLASGSGYGDIDGASGIALDAEASVVVMGCAGTTDFPTTPDAYDQSFNGGWYDAFVAKFDGSGSELLYSTFLGGDDWDTAYGLALTSGGDAVIAGTTLSSDFPTTPDAADTSHNGWFDAFASRLDLPEPVHVPDDDGTIPLGLVLHGNSPNPFGPATRISYELPTATRVRLRVYDVSGRLVRELVDAGLQGPGQHTVPWDGRDHRGRRVASGVYFCRLETGGEDRTGQMILLK